MHSTAAFAILVVFACSKPAADNTDNKPPTPVVQSTPDAPSIEPAPVVSEPDAGGEAKPEETPELEETPEPGSTAAADNSPKNLQVLPKSWSMARVERYMKEDVIKGVGGKCAHCHKKNDFAADTEHKEEARDMIRLTQFINKKYFDKKTRVTCFTCHKGKHEPAQGH